MLNNSAMLHEVKTAGLFLDSVNRFEGIQGFLHPLEGFALMRLAAAGEGVGEIVEIGSFMGKSTCWLAHGSKLAGREKVTAVDHFKGSPEHQKGEQWEVQEIATGGTTFERFQANVQHTGLTDWVQPLVASSEEAVRQWTKPIRLLFIDGDHSYEASRTDFSHWAPFLTDKAYIAFHDVGAWEGVTKFYSDLLGATDQFREVISVNSLRVVQNMVPAATSAALQSA